ncbi:MAG: GGDEF domain-containing protein [Thiobacillus sp.]|nr:GGDEF domain-containing protein [Thiobacillus sp.]
MPAPLIILISSCFMALSMSVVLLIIAKTFPKNIQGLREWALSVLVIALALPLFIARDAIPDLFSIVLANLMLLAAFMLMNAGTRKFSGVPPSANRNLLFWFVLAYVSLFVWFTYIQPNAGTRLAILSLFTLVVILDHLILALKALPKTTGRHFMVFALGVLVGSRILRLGGLMLGFEPPTGIFDNTTSQLFYMALPSVMVPLGTVSFIMLASEKLHRDLEFISRHDGLTQCLNKQSAIEELQREVSRAKRHGNKLSIMLIDLDKFKDINDTHGHLAGDKVLVDFAQKAKISLRDTDRLTRFGGDEFMAILPDTDIEHAQLVASRLHEAGKTSQPIAWSVSIGASAWLDADDSLAAMLNRADKALYQSKTLGRGQTQAL